MVKASVQHAGQRRRAFVIGALVWVVAGLAAPARAAEAPEAREKEAKSACLGGHADRGIEILAQLFAETNDPTYIYNQARCFEQNGRAAESTTRFREYLRKATGLSASERAEVQAHLAEMEAQLANAPKGVPAAEKAPPPAPGASPDSPPPAPAPVVDQPPGPEVDSGHRLRVAGIATAAGGAVLAVAGIYFGLRARSLSREVTDDSNAGTFSQSKYDSGQRAATLQWVGYGAGAALLIGGGALYWFGASHGGAAAEGGARVALYPELGAHGAGGTLRVSF